MYGVQLLTHAIKDQQDARTSSYRLTLVWKNNVFLINWFVRTIQTSGLTNSFNWWLIFSHSVLDTR